MTQMNCELFKQLAPEAISGDLTPETMKQMSDHAEVCSGCAASFARFTSYVGALSSEPMVQPTFEETSGLCTTLHNLMREKRSRSVPVLPRSLPVFLATLLVVYLGIVGVLVRMRNVALTEVVPGWVWPITLAGLIMVVALTTIVPITVSMRHRIVVRHWRL